MGFFACAMKNNTKKILLNWHWRTSLLPSLPDHSPLKGRALLSFELGHNNLVAYYGQDSAMDFSQQMLQNYCNDTTYDVFILSFADVFFGTDSYNGVQLPEVNLANLCQTQFADYPATMDCPEMGEAIKYCQSKGKIVTLSLGGATGAYGFTSDAQANQFANTIWNMFLGGNDGFPRPFGDAILDGVDLDIEGGSPMYYDTLVTTFKKQYFASANKTYYVSGAPQCPFQDAYLGPGANTALSTGLFDFINVQFYNNYCDLSSGSANYATWSQWVSASSPNTKIMVGLPAGPSAAGSGYIPGASVTGKLSPFINDKNFGGVMIWDVSVGEENKDTPDGSSYSEFLSDYLKKNAPSQ
eukprot:gene6692-7782_t